MRSPLARWLIRECVHCYAHVNQRVWQTPVLQVERLAYDAAGTRRTTLVRVWISICASTPNLSDRNRVRFIAPNEEIS